MVYILFTSRGTDMLSLLSPVTRTCRRIACSSGPSSRILANVSAAIGPDSSTAFKMSAYALMKSGSFASTFGPSESDTAVERSSRGSMRNWRHSSHGWRAGSAERFDSVSGENVAGASTGGGVVHNGGPAQYPYGGSGGKGGCRSRACAVRKRQD